MHELSLAGGILQLVEDAARREGFGRGALSGVDAHALRFAIEAIARSTCLQSAELVIEEPPGQAWCMACSQTVTIHSRLDDCPLCHGHQLQATGGTELRVLDLVVHDD